MGKSKAVAITKPPSKKPGVKSVTRNGNKYSVKWTINKEALDEKKHDRYEHIKVRWVVGVYSGKEVIATTRKNKKRVVVKTIRSGKVKKTTRRKITAAEKKSLKVGQTKKKTHILAKIKTVGYDKNTKKDHTDDTFTLSRKKYYPETKTKLVSIQAIVVGKNKKSNNKNESKATNASPVYEFKVPDEPLISDMTLNMETGTLNAVVESDPGAGHSERYWTNAWVYRTKVGINANGKKVSGKETIVNKKLEQKRTSFNIGYDEKEWESWPATNPNFNNYIKIRIAAKNYGLAGDSEPDDLTHIFAYPALPTLKAFSETQTLRIIKDSKKTSDPYGQASVKIVTNSTTYRPVDSVQVQVLKNQEPDVDAIDAAASDDWTIVAEDDKDTGGLAFGISDIISDKGKYTWMRLSSIHDELHLETKPVKLTEIYRSAPTAEDNHVAILKAESGADGTSIAVQLGWDNKSISGDEDATGVEVSWSTNEDAWYSTEQPSAFNVNWADGQSTSDWNKVSNVIIRGLEQGVPYYIRARAYREDGENPISYGPYTDKIGTETDAEQLKITPVSTPVAVTLNAPGYLPEESDLHIYWTYASEAQQTAWQLCLAKKENDTTVAGDVIAGNDNDSSGATTIKWESSTEGESSLKDLVSDEDTIDILLRMTTGGSWITSEPKTVHIVSRPAISISSDSTIRSQPFSFTVDTANTDVRLVVYIEAQGKSQPLPDGDHYQATGDIIWSSSIQKENLVWTASETEGHFIATIDVPVNYELYDIADYTIHASAIDITTGLISEEATANFTVNWAHKADMPGTGTIAVGFSNDGVRGCKIYTKQPADFADTDFCQIYRVTPDGVYLIADNVKYGATVIDRFAPFSKYANLRYLVVTRTFDGHWQGREIPYNVETHLMRFDWGNDYVELPYNNKMSDSFTKDVEIRKHLNGDRYGSWNEGYDRKANLSTDIIKIYDIEVQEKIRALGEYAGPVFVRTPDGCAYEADVEVNTISWEYNKPIMPVSFSATEIKLSDAFKCDRKKDISEEQEVLEPGDDSENPYAEETGE